MASCTAPRDLAFPKSDTIVGIFVRLSVERTRHLWLRLGVAGDIQRAGRQRRGILEGTTSPEVFRQVRRNVTPQLLQWAGQSWTDPLLRGHRCRLLVGFTRPDGCELRTRWEYGSESHEPPDEVREFVLSAVETTDPWYREQWAAQNAPGHPGWRLLTPIGS